MAICDQLEDPKLAKKLVKRGVTELVTPGVSYSDTTLNRKENTFLASVHLNKKQVGVAFLDISTGEFLVAEGTGDYADKLLASFSPKEVLFDRTKRQEFDALFGNKFFTYALDDWAFTPESAHERLLKQFETKTLKGFGVGNLPNGIEAAGAIPTTSTSRTTCRRGTSPTSRVSRRNATCGSTASPCATWSCTAAPTRARAPCSTCSTAPPAPWARAC